MPDQEETKQNTFQFYCEPRLLNFSLVIVFAIPVLAATAHAYIRYLDMPNKESYDFVAKLLSLINIIGYVFLIPLALFLFNLLNKPLHVSLTKDGVEFRFLFRRIKFVQYSFIKEIAKEREREHVTLTLANRKRITIFVGTLPIEIIDQFIEELQKHNSLLKYCIFDTAENDGMASGPA